MVCLIEGFWGLTLMAVSMSAASSEFPHFPGKQCTQNTSDYGKNSDNQIDLCLDG